MNFYHRINIIWFHLNLLLLKKYFIVFTEVNVIVAPVAVALVAVALAAVAPVAVVLAAPVIENKLYKN